MPKLKDGTRDTLERIVEEAIERERLINEQHPERHGYGMIQGETNDLIYRLERLAYYEKLAQAVKIKRREDKVRVLGSDKLYTQSPEDIVINKLDREQVRVAEKNALSKVSERRRDAYFLNELGKTQKEISDIHKVNQSTICRDLDIVNKYLKEELEEIKDQIEL